MSCCVPCKTETVYQNRKAEKKVEDDCKARLELVLAELVKYKTYEIQICRLFNIKLKQKKQKKN